MSKLILFDIDCTLIDTGGAGMSALAETTVEVFGDQGPPLNLAGSTDSGIVRGIFEHFEKELDASLEAQYYDAYLKRLQLNLSSSDFGGKVLPGVVDLIHELENKDHVLGLLTGNIERGAILKVSHYGLAEHFHFGSYGDDHWDRNELGPIAIERANAHTTREFTPNDVVIIGDTHKDVACAQACGAPCIAVATGHASVDDLRSCGADLAVSDLTSPEVRAFIG